MNINHGPMTTTEMAIALLLATASLSSSYDNGLGINVYTGTDNLDKQAPAIICYAESKTEDFPLSGIWHVKTQVQIKEMAVTSSIASIDVLYGDIENALLQPGIETILTNTVPHYFVYQVLADHSNKTVVGDAWTYNIGLDVCCTTTPT